MAKPKKGPEKKRASFNRKAKGTGRTGNAQQPRRPDGKFASKKKG